MEITLFAILLVYIDIFNFTDYMLFLVLNVSSINMINRLNYKQKYCLYLKSSTLLAIHVIQQQTFLKLFGVLGFLCFFFVLFQVFIVLFTYLTLPLGNLVNLAYSVEDQGNGYVLVIRKGSSESFKGQHFLIPNKQ